MKRLYSSQLNFIKLFCALLIVYQHVIAGFLIDPNAGFSTTIIFGSFLNFSRFAVVLFMIISGFLMIKSYEVINFKDFYKFKLRKILSIYIFANLFYLIINYFMGVFTLESVIRGFLTGDSFYHLWYLNLLVKIYLIFPIIKFIVLKITSSSKWFLLTIILGLIQFLIIDKAYGILFASPLKISQLYLTYLDRSLLLWTFYFILGGIIYKKLNLILEFITKYKAFILGFFILDFIYVNYKILTPILNGTNNTYMTGSPSSKLIYPFILLSFFSLFIISDMIVKNNYFNIENILKKASKYILPTYIIHPFALFILNLPFFTTTNFTLNIIIKLSLTYLISFALIWTYFRIKNKIINNKNNIIETVQIKELITEKKEKIKN